MSGGRIRKTQGKSMKEITAPAFQAFDGKVFYSRKECQDYEGSSAARRLSGLTIAQVEAALSRAIPIWPTQSKPPA